MRYTLAEGAVVEEDSSPILLRNEVEASLVDMILKEDGIPHLVLSYRDRAYSSIWQCQYGWGHIDAPARYRNGIRALLAVLRSEADGYVGSGTDDDTDSESPVDSELGG